MFRTMDIAIEQDLSRPTLSGAHVTLAPLELSHLPGLIDAGLRVPRQSFHWTTVPADEAEMRAYVELAMTDDFVAFATLREGRVVGSTRFCNFERWTWPAGSPQQRPRERPDAAEIGWTWLTPDAQRTAVNTEAKLLMLTHAFERWELRRVTLKTDERNAKSRAAIERIGGKLDGLLRGHMPASDQTVRTSAVYSILAFEWPDVKRALLARL
jgi:N-acetyltransferase